MKQALKWEGREKEGREEEGKRGGGERGGGGGEGAGRGRDRPKGLGDAAQRVRRAHAARRASRPSHRRSDRPRWPGPRRARWWSPETGAESAISIVFLTACRPGPPPPGPPPIPPPPPPVLPSSAVSFGLIAVTAYAAPRPMAMPSAPPIRPFTMDSPTTCRVTLREGQPSALRVPNSRTRRDTAEEVSSAARNAATSTAMDSHLPTLVARFEAVDREPETVEARSAEVVTVVPEMFFWMVALTVVICLESVALT